MTNEKLGWCWQNPCDAYGGSPNIVPFHMLGIVSCYVLVTLSLRCVVFQIFNFKMSWLEIQSKVTQGHRKWSAFDSSYTSSYSPSIVTMTLSCVVCEILVEISKFYTPRRNFEKLLDVHKTIIIGLRNNIGTWWIDLLYQCRASVCWLMKHMLKTIIVNKYDIEFWTIPDKSETVLHWNNAGASGVRIVYSLGVRDIDDITRW